MSTYSRTDEAISNDEAMDLLQKHGPQFASRLADEAVSAAKQLIWHHANALDTLGMKGAARDLFLAIAHIAPLPQVVSRAYGMDLDEKIRMQRSSMAGIMAVAFSQSEDPAVKDMAKGIADKIAENSPVTEYEPMDRT